MGRQLRTYVSVTGLVTQKIYERLPYSKRTKRFRCPMNTCDNSLVRLYVQIRGVATHFGLYCSSCESVFVTKGKNVYLAEVN